MVSLVERDGLALDVRDGIGSPLLEPMAGALQAAGLCVTDCREATAADVADRRSSWAKRLRIPDRRPAWLLTATRLGRADYAGSANYA